MEPQGTLTFRGYGNEEESAKEPEKEQPEIEKEKRVSTISLISSIKCFWKRRCPLKGTMHKLTLVVIHTEWRDGGSGNAVVTQGETEYCGFRVRFRGIAFNAPMFSTTTWSMDTIFPGLSTPLTQHQPGELHQLHPGAPLWPTPSWLRALSEAASLLLCCCLSRKALQKCQSSSWGARDTQGETKLCDLRAKVVFPHGQQASPFLCRALPSWARS